MDWFDAHKLKAPKIEEMKTITTEIQEQHEEIEMGFDTYEAAADSSGDESTEQREIGREEVWFAALKILEEAEKLKALMETLT